MSQEDDEVAKAKFRDQVRPKPGEWNFAGFYTRAPETPADQRAIANENLRAIIDGTHHDMRLSHIKDLVGTFIRQHEATLREHADALIVKRNTQQCYIDSPLHGKDNYYAFMDKYIDALKKAVAEYKDIADTGNKNRGTQVLNGWLSDISLVNRLDEALRQASAIAHKNDLRITNDALMEKIKRAHADFEPVALALKAGVRQSASMQMV